MAAIEIEIRQKCFYLHIFCYSLLDSTLLELKEINKASSPLSNGLLVKLSSEKSRKLFLFRHCHVLLREYKQYIFSWFYTLKTFLEQGINKGKIRKISLRYSNFFLSYFINATGFPTLTIEWKSFDFEKIWNGMGKRTNIAWLMICRLTA